jgi:hypothetical protein
LLLAGGVSDDVGRRPVLLVALGALMASSVLFMVAGSAAKRFFARSLHVVGDVPEKVTTDGHDAYPRAIRETLGAKVVHRCSRYLNNKIEQDHRGIKGRCHPMRGFGSFRSAARSCSAYDELRDYFRHRTRMYEMVPLGVQREQFCARSAALRAMLNAA